MSARPGPRSFRQPPGWRRTGKRGGNPVRPRSRETIAGRAQGQHRQSRRNSLRRVSTAKYLLEASYTAEGAKGLSKEGGSSRRKKIEKMIRALDGKLEAFYYAFGPTDAYLIVDVPDSVTAAALSLAVNQSGAVQLRTHVLLTPEEMDQATEKTVKYKAPGE